MPVITYTAKRSLVGGHTVGLPYQIETHFWSRPEVRTFRGHRRTSLSGVVESYLHRIDKEYAIVSDTIGAATINNWNEFLDSVMNAESFEIDFTGTIASPGTDVLVWLVSESIREAEIGPQLKQFQFTVRRF